MLPSMPRVVSLPALPLAGVLGTVLLAAWVATDHYDLHGNLNLLWANPLLFVAWLPAAFRTRWGAWVRGIAAAGTILWLGAGWALPQTVPTWALPWAIAVLISLQPWNLVPASR
jgi:hypothetical protein